MRFSLPLLLVSLPLFVGCSGSSSDAGGGVAALPADTSEVIGEAGGYTVTQAEWDAELLSIPTRARARYESDKAKKDLTERIILNKALFQDAKAAGVTSDPAIQRSAQMAAEQAYIKAFFAQLEESAATEEKVTGYYNENIDRYSRPMVRLRHILVKEEGLANELKAKIDGGADFADLAKEHSLDRASKPKGGELNWATKERYVPPFAEVAFALPTAGAVSAPVKTRFGFHIIELLERRDVQPLEDVRSGIERVLVRDAVRDHRSNRRTELGLGGKERTPSPKLSAPAEGAREKKASSSAPASPSEK
jgi:peptidyl-prolyl cis-trans isomerase C